MSQEIWMRCLWSAVYGCMFIVVIFFRNSDEKDVNSTQQKYLPVIPGYLLPSVLLGTMVTAVFLQRVDIISDLIISACFNIFLQISAYYVLLILLMPLFRRKIRAGTCAMLWMIPNFLYITSMGFMELQEPAVVLQAPGRTAEQSFVFWFIGFVLFLLWKSAEHLLFRRRVLSGSREATDPELLAMLHQIICDIRIKKPKFKLVISPQVSTPLSVGLFDSSVRIVLPEKKYEKEELELILKHEVIHIAKQDSWSKFFLVFCTAMCWFNPLMWIAMRKSAEDLELSCDETVISDADEQTRKKYAALLLETGGDERGFTTCLSASARSVRYRLKCITKPARRYNGAFIIGLVFFCLCMSSGYVALAYDEFSGEDAMFSVGDVEEYTVQYVSRSDDGSDQLYSVLDQDRFCDYLAGMTLKKVTGNYSYSDQKWMFCLLESPERRLYLRLYNQFIEITSLDEEVLTSVYYVPGGIDWDYLSNNLVLSDMQEEEA